MSIANDQFKKKNAIENVWVYFQCRLLFELQNNYLYLQLLSGHRHSCNKKKSDWTNDSAKLNLYNLASSKTHHYCISPSVHTGIAAIHINKNKYVHVFCLFIKYKSSNENKNIST